MVSIPMGLDKHPWVGPWRGLRCASVCVFISTHVSATCGRNKPHTLVVEVFSPLVRGTFSAPGTKAVLLFDFSLLDFQNASPPWRVSDPLLFPVDTF